MHHNKTVLSKLFSVVSTLYPTTPLKEKCCFIWLNCDNTLRTWQLRNWYKYYVCIEKVRCLCYDIKRYIRFDVSFDFTIGDEFWTFSQNWCYKYYFWIRFWLTYRIKRFHFLIIYNRFFNLTFTLLPGNPSVHYIVLYQCYKR